MNKFIMICLCDGDMWISRKVEEFGKLMRDGGVYVRYEGSVGDWLDGMEECGFSKYVEEFKKEVDLGKGSWLLIEDECEFSGVVWMYSE